MKFKIKLERTNINLIDASHFLWGLACINVPIYWPQYVLKIDYVSSLCPSNILEYWIEVLSFFMCTMLVLLS